MRVREANRIRVSHSSLTFFRSHWSPGGLDLCVSVPVVPVGGSAQQRFEALVVNLSESNSTATTPEQVRHPAGAIVQTSGIFPIDGWMMKLD
jgi:hypothetical protein